MRASREPLLSAHCAGTDREHSASTERTLGELDAAVDRCQYALELVMERTRARTGHLYWSSPGGGVQLAAASAPCEPAPELQAELRARVARAQACSDGAATAEVPLASANDAHDCDAHTVFIHSEPPEAAAATHQIVLLTHVGSHSIAGALLLETAPERLLLLEPWLLDAIASALAQRTQHQGIPITSPP